MSSEVELERMVVRLVGDGSEYQKMLTQAQEQTQRAAGVIEEGAKKIENFGHGLKGFAANAVSALASLGAMSFLKGAFSGFSDAERGQIKLSAAIKGGGHDVASTLAEYKQFADTVASQTLNTKGATLSLLKQAETYGLSGKAAEEATLAAIGLATATDGEASSLMRMAAALARGDIEMAQHMSRMIPQLKQYKDAGQFVQEAQKLIAQGLQTAGAEANTTSGKIEKLWNSVNGLKKEFGKFVEEAIRPFVIIAQDVVNWFKGLDDGAKKLITQVMMLSAAALMVGPAISLMKTLAFAALSPIGMMVNIVTTGFGLLTGAIGMVGATIGFLLSPIGLVLAGVAGLAAYFIDWGQVAGQAVDGFMSKWRSIANEFNYVISGVMGALKAGNFALAFKIIWTEIQLAFHVATNDMQENWQYFVTGFREMWAEVTEWVQIQFSRITSAAAATMIQGQRMLRLITQEEADAATKNLIDTHNALLEELATARKNALAGADKDALEAIDDIAARLKRLKAERDGLVGQGNAAGFLKDLRDTAFQWLEDKPLLQMKPIIPKIPDQTANLKLKVDATSIRSAEAFARVSEYFDGIAVRSQAKAQGKAEGGNPFIGVFGKINAAADAALEAAKPRVGNPFAAVIDAIPGAAALALAGAQANRGGNPFANVIDAIPGAAGLALAGAQADKQQPADGVWNQMRMGIDKLVEIASKQLEKQGDPIQIEGAGL